MDDGFKTLRGFVSGKEPGEEIYFAYSATFRIFGEIPNFEEISTHLSLQPTKVHRKSDNPGPRSSGFGHDMWQYSSPLHESRPLYEHIDALWSVLKPHKAYLLELKSSLTVDVFLGYRSNCDHAGLELPYASLAMFTELQIPFGVSIIIA